MNPTMSSSKLAIAAVCGLILAACDSVTTVDEKPTFPIPAGKVVVNGTVSGLSTTRAIELTMTVTNNGLNDGTTTRTFLGTNTLRFGAVDVGASYEIAISKEPFGRDCTIQNGSGTATAEVNDVTVTCVRDATPLNTVTANIAAGVANNPPPGFEVVLTTEEGVEVIAPAQGQTSVTFTNPVLNSGTNLPSFAYAVTARYVDGNVTNNCAVTGASGTNPVADVVVNVTACTFTVGGSVAYLAPPGGAPGATGALQLGLKDLDGEIVETVNVAAAAPTFAFPTALLSNSEALYELAVTEQPASQHCIVANGGTASLVATPPTSFPANITGLQVRCRATPVLANQLTGSYQLQPVAPATTQVRNFLTFFANGTFLHGTHHSSTAAGVEHGFYNYNPGTNMIAFTVVTDSNGGGASFGGGGPPPGTTFSGDFLTAFLAASATGGISGTPGYALPLSFTTFQYGLPGTATATGVLKTAGTPTTPGTLSLTFGATTWSLVEPVSVPGEMTGAWVTADTKRVWIYDKDTSYGWHAGVNGAPNLQDRCFAIEDPTVASGFYSQRPAPDFFGFATCMLPGGNASGSPTLVAIGSVDVPSATSTPAIVPGFAGRMPGTQSTGAAGPSPNYFTVTPGSPDTLTIQGTLNDIPIGDPIVFTRHTAN